MEITGCFLYGDVSRNRSVRCNGQSKCTVCFEAGNKWELKKVMQIGTSG